MNTVLVLEGNLIERKRKLEQLKSSLSDYEIFVFDKDNYYGYVSQMITELSCFGRRRLFLIEELPQIKIENKTKAQIRTKIINNFKKLFPKIPAGNIIVFYGAGISAESFFKEVRKYGKVYKFAQKVRKNDAKRIVSKYFQKRKMIINDDISSLVIDSLNPIGNDVDIDYLYLLMKKLYNYVYNKNNITKEDIYAICSSSKEFIIWTLYNLLDKKDYSSSISLIVDYIENTKYYQYEAIMLIKGMTWRYGLLLMAKNGINNKMSQKEIRDKISNINKLESSGRSYKMKMRIKTEEKKSIPEYSIRMIDSIFKRRYGNSAISCYTINELILIYYVLVKTLVKIRSGCTDAEIMIAIQIIVLVICGEIKKKNTLDGVLEHKKILYGKYI